MITQSPSNCGMVFLDQLSRGNKNMVEEVFKYVGMYYGGKPGNNVKYPVCKKGLVIFSDGCGNDEGKSAINGEGLAEYIRENKLGQIWESEYVTNPVHTDTKIKVWSWNPDYKMMSKHLEA